MAKHTPGPWTLADWSEDDGPNKTTLTSHVPCEDEWEKKLWGSPCKPVRIAELSEAENVDGNGPLLCAAPDLLEALQVLERSYVNMICTGYERITALGGDCDPVERMVEGDPYLKLARAAIAKAKG